MHELKPVKHPIFRSITVRLFICDREGTRAGKREAGEVLRLPAENLNDNCISNINRYNHEDLYSRYGQNYSFLRL